MQNKLLEIRDRKTFIPIIAISMQAKNEVEQYYFVRSGYLNNCTLINVIRIDVPKCNDDPYKWSHSSRTMQIAHEYIQKHWNELNTGDVVDVEYISGETSTPKQSERFL
jgi:hypothetical protein